MQPINIGEKPLVIRTNESILNKDGPFGCKIFIGDNCCQVPEDG
jgi:hypothetical protein